MMQRVRGVIAGAMRRGSMQWVSGSGSTGTGTAPTMETASHVAM